MLEGSYLRCGLVSDVMLMDGYPSKYTSFMNRLSRWIRGDWQITKWLGNKSPLNLLSKYKIFDNLRRSLFEISIIVGLIYAKIIKLAYKINTTEITSILIIILLIPFILEILNYLIGKKEGEETQKTFTPQITGLKGTILRGFLTLGCIPYKAYVSIKAILKTWYRVNITHKHLLEWTTSEEAEKLGKTDFVSYYKSMIVNVIAGIISLIIYANAHNIFSLLIGAIWVIIPGIMYYISKENTQKNNIEILSKQEQCI